MTAKDFLNFKKPHFWIALVSVAVLGYAGVVSVLDKEVEQPPVEETITEEIQIEFEEEDAEGNLHIRYEKADNDELASLVQLDLTKEELIAMQKIKKPNGTLQFDLSPDAKSKNFHD